MTPMSLSSHTQQNIDKHETTDPILSLYPHIQVIIHTANTGVGRYAKTCMQISVQNIYSGAFCVVPNKMSPEIFSAATISICMGKA